MPLPKDFNPRTPCGVRLSSPNISMMVSTFQSTHPVRGATVIKNYAALLRLFQSTHPVRGATDPTDPPGTYREFQSTHPVRGATGSPGCCAPAYLHFNPRTPCGVRRATCPVGRKLGKISIHAPRAGCDCGRRLFSSGGPGNFNPRTPCGVRLNAHRFALYI